MGRVFVVRHGNTFDKGDIIRRVGGKTDLPLSRSGIEQAKRLKTHFETVQFNAAFSSDLKRTRQTVEAILGGQSYEIAEMLTEIDYGPDEGKPEDEVINRLGQQALRDWDRHAVPPEGWHIDPQALRKDWVAFLASCSRSTDTLVVTSNGVARFVLDVVERNGSEDRKLRTGSYGIINLSDRGPKLEGWNIRPED